jgi:hypothetical protein
LSLEVIIIDLSARFQRDVSKLTDRERGDVESALKTLAKSFGDVHAHAGIGIRRLRKNLFECRAGLRLRIAFFVRKGGHCICHGVGDHDYIRALIKNLKR